MRNKIIIVFTAFLALSSCKESEPTYEFPFLNPSMSMEDRVDDLVSRMTPQEKIGQMMNEAPAIPRLHVPEYNWWSEGLHGIARAGLATVFPQAIGMAATWDEETMHEMAVAISDETRAKHHDFASKGKRFLYQGLTLWSPNINIFVDPRWGRGQETYGEDPYLTGKLGVQFIKGLQGNDPKYYKTVATVKHFAVHNGPEPERHVFNALASQKDMNETYLPQFEMGVKEGGAYSAMCAYNRTNGEACCGSSLLMNDLLRKQWGFDGFIVSDCGAVLDIFENHKVTESASAGAALAVKSGTDLNCGKYYNHLNDALAKGELTEADLDVAVKRLFLGRMKLGMFDPDEMVKFAQIPYDVVDSKKHQDLALKTAQKSMVLLKNEPFKGQEKNMLPLNKSDYKTIGVIGPNANQWLMLLGNYNGVPSSATTPLAGIQAKIGSGTEVLYAQGSQLSDGMPMFYTIEGDVLTHDGQPGLNVDYFNNDSLSGDVLYSEVMENLDVNWNDKAPRDDMDDDAFSARWTGEITPKVTSDYQLGFISTCNTKMYLDGKVVAETVYHFRDEYGDPRLRKSEFVKLEAGKTYKLRIDAIETFADAQIQMVWARPQPELLQEAIDVANKSDIVVMCMGLTARMEGEEMDIQIDGFRGGDRTKLDLPMSQQKLIKAIHATGKPTVLVMLNGSAIALNWEDQNIPAILEAWYPGQAAGHAIADVLFGDYNPAGRLPVTVYKSVDDLPAFEDYEMTTQTYRYFKDEPLYPFGHGLSYSTFKYDDISVNGVGNNQYEITGNITNTSDVDGEEVVQLYISTPSAEYKLPIRSLKRFDRVNIPAQTTKTIKFTLEEKDFKVIDGAGNEVLLNGDYSISIGGGQEGIKSKITI